MLSDEELDRLAKLGVELQQLEAVGADECDLGEQRRVAAKQRFKAKLLQYGHRLIAQAREANSLRACLKETCEELYGDCSAACDSYGHVAECRLTNAIAEAKARKAETAELRATNARLAEAVKAADHFIKRHTDGRGCTTKLDPLNCGSAETMIASVAAALQPAPDAPVAGEGTPIMGTDTRYGRCDCCGEPVEEMNPSWRFDGKNWQHRCREVNEKCPQAGHIGTARPDAGSEEG